jgi:FlaA1/EpsC-like NDP-sugar epimerase
MWLLDFLTDNRILITGGAGSLGREIISFLLKANPSQIIVFSRDEAKHSTLVRNHFQGNSTIKCIIGDVRDYGKLLMSTKGVDYIIHAGALKQIDTMEFNPVESIRTNVDGSVNVAKAAYVNKVKKCILVSTDKACMATSAYGATKFLGEKVFTYFDYEFGDNTVFSSVRYGNVAGSTGSFIPYWLEKIREGERIPVTLFEMTRFLFTLDDAANTVLKALRLSEGGEIFVPQISSYEIRDILEVLAEHYEAELRTENLGKRAGEKIHEDMMNPLELERAYAKNGLLVILPELSRRNYTYKERYEGPILNSKLHVEKDRAKILNLLKRCMGI